MVKRRTSGAELRRLRRKASGGDVAAQVELANRYCGAPGERSDYRQARTWFERAARAGSTEAMLTLGLVLLRGKGGPRNPRRAAQLLARASRLGNDSAAWILAHDYEKGLLVRRNLRKALEWNCFRAERGDVSAMRSAKRLAEKHGLELPPRRVTAWYRAAAERGDRDALYWLGHRLSDGAGVRRNPRAAYSAWQRAADLGKASAYYMLGWSHEYGEGARQSWPRALACYRAAARRGDDDVCHKIADYYARIEKNPRLRVRWLRRAARHGHAESQWELGIHFIHGAGVRQSSSEAARLYRLSAEQGQGWAMQLLGRCYKDGEGVRRDRRTARRWFERAIEAGKKEECPETVRVAQELLENLRKARKPLAETARSRA